MFLSSAMCYPTSRVQQCAQRLSSGTAWTVGELGHYAGVSRSTATEHVNKLVKVDLAHDIRQGRHRYVTLAGSHVAEVIEALGVLSSDLLPTPQSLNAHRTTKALADARTCYSHLAGRLGVRLCTHFIEQGFIAPDWAVTTDGVNFFHSLGIDGSKRLMAKACLDCTERQFHVGGALGTYVCQQFFVSPVDNTGKGDSRCQAHSSGHHDAERTWHIPRLAAITRVFSRLWGLQEPRNANGVRCFC